MRPTAMQVIQSEHQSIAAVLQGLRFLAEALRKDGTTPDCTILRAMLFYLDTFSDRFHHPKEDRYLFARMRKRTNEAEDIIARLEVDHAQGEKRLCELTQMVIRLEFASNEYAKPFIEKVEEYIEFYFRHMGLEEDIVLPLAQRTLTAEDWGEIDSAFSSNMDPLLGVDAKKSYDQLFARIVGFARGNILIA
jgi:hemerythrin-like domain-containing protein